MVLYVHVQLYYKMGFLCECDDLGYFWRWFKGGITWFPDGFHYYGLNVDNFEKEVKTISENPNKKLEKKSNKKLIGGQGWFGNSN